MACNPSGVADTVLACLWAWKAHLHHCNRDVLLLPGVIQLENAPRRVVIIPDLCT